MDNEKLVDFRTELLDWGDENYRDLPWRRLNIGPYGVLIAEIFLQQTRTETVERVYPRFYKRYPNFEELREASRDEITSIIRPLGLYNDRADALIEISEKLAGSSVPDDQDELMELPQVGRYVANATLCFAYDEPRPIIDSNVRRIYARVLGEEQVRNMNEKELWSLAGSVVPEESARQYNMALLDFGAAICTSSSPNCEACFASNYCAYYQGSSSQNTGRAPSV